MVSYFGWLKWKKAQKTEIELRTLAVGFNSSVNIAENLHILFLDFDIKEYKKVRESVKECQDFWNLSHAYIFETKNGFHAVFYYDLMPYERCKLIIEYAKYVDPMFKYISKFYSHKTLRTAGKHKENDIKMKSIIPGLRQPNTQEKELGELKRKEHFMLIPAHMRKHKRRVVEKN